MHRFGGARRASHGECGYNSKVFGGDAERHGEVRLSCKTDASYEVGHNRTSKK